MFVAKVPFLSGDKYEIKARKNALFNLTQVKSFHLIPSVVDHLIQKMMEDP